MSRVPNANERTADIAYSRTSLALLCTQEQQQNNNNNNVSYYALFRKILRVEFTRDRHAIVVSLTNYNPFWLETFSMFTFLPFSVKQILTYRSMI